MVTEELRKLHNEELNDWRSSPSIIRVIKLRGVGRAVQEAGMWERIGAYRILVDKPEGKRPLGRPGRGWEYNVTMDFREWDGRHGLD